MWKYLPQLWKSTPSRDIIVNWWYIRSVWNEHGNCPVSCIKNENWLRMKTFFFIVNASKLFFVIFHWDWQHQYKTIHKLRERKRSAYVSRFIPKFAPVVCILHIKQENVEVSVISFKTGSPVKVQLPWQHQLPSPKKLQTFKAGGGVNSLPSHPSRCEQGFLNGILKKPITSVQGWWGVKSPPPPPP